MVDVGSLEESGYQLLTDPMPSLAERDWRYARVRDAMVSAQVEGLLAFAPAWRRENVRYLTGAPLRGSWSLAYLPDSGDPVAFSTNHNDADAISQVGWVEQVHSPTNGLGPLVDALTDTGGTSTLGIAHYELVPQWLMAEIKRALPHVEIVPATELMDLVRIVKSDWEVDQLRRSGDVCAQGWDRLVECMKPGIAEFELVAEVEARLKELGATDNFMLIASGKDEVTTMAPPGTRQLGRGDMLRTELTPRVNGYWTQVCRSAVVGEPTSEQYESFELFDESLEAGLSVVRPGVTADEIARAENDVFRKHGFGEYCTSKYTRVRGHGHGLHLDEIPIIEGQHTSFEKNSVFIIHPNTYTPLAGYHVLGDAVVVTDEGYEPLMDLDRKLFSSQL